MAAAPKKPALITTGPVAENRRARYDYFLEQTFEAGLSLTGTEVKALREGKAQLNDAYAVINDGELWMRNAHIPPYAPAARENHEPERPRKLLLKRREIERLIGTMSQKGLTLVPTRIYFKGRHAKVELALARNKEGRDRRRDIAKRDVEREIARDYKQRL